MDSKVDLILHPVRMRMIQTLVGGRSMTAQQIADLLPDVPQATLYRHLNKLLKGGILSIVDQRQVRGAVEKTYALHGSAASISADDLASATREDHMRYFMTFVAGLLDDFGRYLEQDHVDMARDGVGYRQATVYLTDEEFMSLAQTIGAALQKAIGNRPGAGRRRRTITTIVMADPKSKLNNE